ncbi:hypothetical protein ACFLY7_00645 [Patescibacteria group bacterium]
MKIRLIVKYFDEYITSNNCGNGINRYNFVEYLVFQKKFRQDFRDTIRNWYINFFKNGNFGSIKKTRILRAVKQRKEIKDCLDYCLLKNYIFIKRVTTLNPTDSDVYLDIDFRGRDFLKWPDFFNACLERYGHLKSLLLGGGGVLFIKFIFSFLVN